MEGFFNIENGFFTTLGKVTDVIFLSVLWAVFCIPIITIGPATTALYYTTAKVVRRDRGYVFKEFWASFKSNFITGVIYTLMLVALTALFYFNFRVVTQTSNTVNSVLFYCYCFMVCLIFCCTVYLFPVLSRFTMTKLQTIKMSLLLSIKHFPSTILISLIVLGCGLVLYVVPPTIFFMPGVIALLVSLVIEKVFRRYMPKTKEEDKDKDKDELEWYMTF